MKTLSGKQKKTLDYIKSYINKKGMSPSYAEIAEHFDNNVSFIHQAVQALIKKGYLEKTEGMARGLRLKETEQDVVKHNLILIPLYGKVAAGEPIFIDDNVRGYIPVEKNMRMRGNEYALTVEGDSMIERHIIGGDNIVVRKQNYAEDGDVVVALVDEEVTVKIFRKKNGSIYLQPANELYKPIKKPFQILGIVIGLTRELDIVYTKD
jgi:repressor LexA